MSHRIIVWVLLGLLCLTGTVSAMGSTNYGLDWNTLSGGGGFISSPSYRLQGVIGQMAGSSSSAHYLMQGGFLVVQTVPSGDAITVMSPNGGGTFYIGSPLPMSWTYTGNPGTTVNIEVLKGGAILKVLSGVPIGSGGSGSYTVTNPSSTP